MKDLIDALAQAQAEMKAATFDKVNPHFKSKYASLNAVIDAVRGPLTKHGVSYIQRAVQVEHGVGIETVFYGHGHEIATGVVAVPVDKATAQGLGSALTYARRYSLSMACCIASDEDDDGNAATAQPPKAVERKGTRVVDAALVGETWDQEQAGHYVSAIRGCVAREDWAGFDQLHEEFKGDNIMAMAIWADLTSVERTAIKKHQAAQNVAA